jgi:hypothetical protein
LEVTDIQNDDEQILSEKQNESAPELNGTVRTDDEDAGKVTAVATGTAAVIAVATGVAALNSCNEDPKGLPAETEAITQSGSASTFGSPAPADSEADTAEATEDGEARSPLPVKSGREAIVAEVVTRSGATGEPEDNGPLSTLIPEGTPKSSVDTSRESVPEDKPYTAKPDETPEQGSRPSASQIVINEDYVDSNPTTSAVVDGTRPTSASAIEGETVPEQVQEEETSLPPTNKESLSSRPQSTTEQGTESQKGSRPCSSTETSKQEERPENSISLSKDEAESTIEATDVAQIDSLPVKIGESVERPASVAQETEKPKMTTGSVSEDGNSSESVTESRKGEETGPAASAAEDIEVSDRVESNRPVNDAVSNKEEGNRPLSASEPTKREGSTPEISAVASTDVSGEPAGSQPASSVKSAKEEGNVAAEKTEVFEKSAEISSYIATELEDTGSRPAADTIENSKENAGSRPVSVIECTAEDGSGPVSASQSIKEKEDVVAGKVELPEDTTGSPLTEADELGAEVIIPESSTVSSVLNSVETAGVLPVSVAESTNEIGIRSPSATDSNKEAEARPISSIVHDANVSEEPAGSRLVTDVESTEGEGTRLASTIDTNLNEERPTYATISGGNSSYVADVEVSEKPVENLPVSTEEEGNCRSVDAEDRPEDGGSKTVSVSEVVRMEEAESSTVENTDLSEGRLENQLVSLVYTIDGEGSLLNSATLSSEEATSRPTSLAEEEKIVVEQGKGQISAKEGNIPKNPVESTKEGSTSVSVIETTKEDKVISAIAAESTKEADGNRQLSTTDLTEQEESRPSGIVSAVKEDGSRSSSASELTKDQMSSSVSAEDSTKDEEIKLARKEDSRSVAAPGLTEESRSDSAVESVRAGSRPVSASGSTKGEGSRPPSVVAEGARLIETLHSLQDSVSDSLVEQGSVPESSETEDADNSAELRGTKTVIATESTEKEYRPVSSVTVKQSSSARVAEPEVVNGSTELAAESTEDVQTARSLTVLTDTEQEAVNTASHPSLSVPLSAVMQANPEDGTFTEEAGNDRLPTESRTFGAESDITVEASELEGSSSSAVRGSTEWTESPKYSVIAQSSEIPSATGTEATAEPGSDTNNDMLGLEDKPATGNVEAKRSVENEDKELNAAATTIQATFRGYQARQALSKVAENDEVKIGHHTFLFLL